MIPPMDHVGRNVVAALADPLLDSRDRELGAGNPQVDQVKDIAGFAQFGDPGSEGLACQCGLEREAVRWAASSRSRRNINFPAERAAPSGLNPDRPRAITSAFTNSVTSKAPSSKYGALVDFPAPFGPARITTAGLISIAPTLYPRCEEAGH